ncbi:MAG: hypothetical protein K2X81_13925 [Candidatus Obscuribacterales bacterium]|nr:hypothetical protein [Candidatus Obscuribacterales bacterium]
MINTVTSTPAVFAPMQSTTEQAACQLIPKEYVRVARKLYQEKIEQERLAKQSIWQKIFGN